jgi:hypothetical protein
MAKMCKYWHGPDVTCGLFNTDKPCPKGAHGTTCRILPKRCKDKVIKAWVSTGILRCLAIMGNGTIRSRKINGDVLVYITIKAKDWEKLKEAK